MTDEEFKKARAMMEEQWQGVVRIIAPKYGVNAEDLLRKAPRFPVSADPGQVQAMLNEIGVKAEDWTEAESTVCMVAHKAMMEMFFAVLRNKYSDLPEFGEK